MKKKQILFLGSGLYLKKLTAFYPKTLYNLILIDFKKKQYLKNFQKKFIINLRDQKKIFQIAKNNKIDYVITDQNDFSMLSYGYVCDKLKIPGVSFQNIKRVTDKLVCRKYLKNKLRKNIPNFFIFQKEKKKIFSHLNKKKKLIIKPTLMQGSRYVNLVSNKKDLFKNIKKLNNVKENFILEEYISGKDYAVESFVNNYQVKNLVISEKKKFNCSFIDKFIIFKNFTDKMIEKRIFSLNKKIIKTLKLKKGLIHAEFRVDNSNNIFLIEIAHRGAGSGISSIVVPFLTGFKVDNFLFSLSVGKKFTQKDFFKSKKKCFLGWTHPSIKISKLPRKIMKNILFLKKKNQSKNKNYTVKESTDRGSYIIYKFKNNKELEFLKKNILKY